MKEYPIVVKILQDDGGEVVEDPKWHYVTNWSDGERAFCSGEVFGVGESNVLYEKKRGKITCPVCIANIKQIKKIRL